MPSRRPIGEALSTRAGSAHEQYLADIGRVPRITRPEVIELGSQKDGAVLLPPRGAK